MADRILKPDSGNDLVLQNDDASAKIEINENGTIPVTGTLSGSVDVSGGSLTTSSAQKQTIVQAGPGSGTLDVSSGTFTTSSAQKQAIVDGASNFDVSSGTFTTSSAQKQAIVQAGPGSGTLDVSSGTFTTSTAQKTAILSGGTFPNGHIIQSVFSPTITNKNTSNSGSTELAVMDVRGQITLSSSSNGCFVFFNAWVYTNASSNSYGKCFIRKGTTSSFSTILVSQRFGDGGSDSVYAPLSVWGFDASPGSTTPDYVFTIERDSGGTTGVQFLDNADTTRCHLFEVKQ